MGPIEGIINRVLRFVLLVGGLFMRDDQHHVAKRALDIHDKSVSRGQKLS